MIYSLIPAKMHSRRLPNKNTFSYMLGDKPLIAHTIEAVSKAGLRPIVFTDEPNIKNTYGATIAQRPAETTLPRATMREVICAFIKHIDAKPTDTIVVTYLTCPFRSSTSIGHALQQYTYSQSNSLQSLTKVDYRPYGLMRRKYEHEFECVLPQGGIYQQQNTPPLYKANGAIYIFGVSELEKLNDQLFNDKTIGYVLDDCEGLDLDTDLDCMLAEKILERRACENSADKLSGTRICEA